MAELVNDYPTALGAAEPTMITLLGRDLARDVMGSVGFGEPAFWLATQRRPTVRAHRAAGAFVPGLGHHLHKVEDPRTPALLAIAAEEGLVGPHLELFSAIGRVHPEVLGRRLALNGAGVCGAALADLGLPLPLLRGFALLARTAGLIGQLAEELRSPVANEVFREVEGRTRSVPPDAGLGHAARPVAAGGRVHRQRGVRRAAPCDERRCEDLTTRAVARWSSAPTRAPEVRAALDPAATPATVLGPFHIDGSPELGSAPTWPTASPAVRHRHGARHRRQAGAVAGAVLDVRQADADGAHEAQLGVEGARLRGRFSSREDGTYCVRTIAPTGYTIPLDGPVGELIGRTPDQPVPPAHAAFPADRAGHRTLVTHLFRRGAEYLDRDVVSGTKVALVVDFEPREPGLTPDGGSGQVAWTEARYDFVRRPER